MNAHPSLRPGTIERAFQLAATVPGESLDDIARQLGREGYERVAEHLSAPLLRKQLRQACASTGAAVGTRSQRSCARRAR